MTLQKTRRAGISLVEVLMAIFIMALGLMALLTLFPLGALQMAQSLKDDRTAQAATLADNIIRTHWKKHVLERRGRGLQPDPFVNAFTNPQDPSFGPVNPPKPVVNTDPNAMPPLNNAGSNQPSYPVFLDPRGFRSLGSNPTFASQKFWLAEAAPANMPRIPRRSFATVEAVLPAGLNNEFERNPANINSPLKLEPYRVATLLDDLTYNENASARRLSDPNDPASPPLPVERQGRYTWAYMLQLPVVNNPNQCNLTVVVYDTRNPDFPVADGEVVYGNARPPTAARFDIGSTSVTFTYDAGDAAPNVRPGTWILDGTLSPRTFQNTANPLGTLNNVLVRSRLANCYRVIGVEHDETNRTMRLDLQTPIKALPLTANMPAVVGGYFGDLYVLKGVAEVFERIPLSASNLPD